MNPTIDAQPTELTPAEDAGNSKTIDFSGALILLMVAVLPPLHATGFTRNDDLRTPVFLLLSTLCFIAAFGNKKSNKLIRILSLSLLGFLGLQFIFVTSPLESWSFWDAFALTPLASMALLMGSQQNVQSKWLNFKTFSAATSIGIITSGIFSLLDLFQIEYANVIWKSSSTFGAFDSHEFAIAYLGMGCLITLTGALTTHGGLRFLSAFAALFAAFLFGAYPWQSEIALVVLGMFAFYLIGLPLVFFLIQLKSNKNHEGDEKDHKLAYSLRKKRFLFGIILSILTGAGFFVHYYNDQTVEQISIYNEQNQEKKESFKKRGDVDWANSLPSISEDNNPHVKGRALKTTFASGRWESLPQSTQELSTLNHAALSLAGEHILFGHGPLGWWNSQTKIASDNPKFVQNYFHNYPAYKTSHNAYLDLLVNYGILGTLLFLGLLLAPIIQSMIKHSDSESTTLPPETVETIRFQRSGLLLALLVGLTCAIFSPAFQLVSPLLLFASIVLLFLKTDTERSQNSLESPSEAASGNALESNPRQNSALGKIQLTRIPYYVIAAALLVNATYCTLANLQRSKGDQFLLYSELELAKKHYTKADELAPGNSDFPYNLAVIEYLLGSPENTLSLLDQALQIRPYDARYHMLKAEALFRNKEISTALASANNTLKYNPNNISAYIIIATIHQLMLKTPQAIEILEKSLKTNPPRHEQYKLNNQLGELYLDFIKDPSKATTYLEAAFKNAVTTTEKSESERTLLRAKLQQEVVHLQREGKPIPPMLSKKIEELNPHHHHNHGHANHQHTTGHGPFKAHEHDHDHEDKHEHN